MEQNISLNLLVSNLTCEQNNPIKYLCKNKQCKFSASLCQNTSCSCYNKNHVKCQKTEMLPLFKAIQKKRKPIPETMLQVVQEITTFYDRILDKISQDREAFRQWRENYGMNKFQRDLILKLQEEKSDEIIGSDIAIIIKNIKITNYTTFTKTTLEKLLHKQLQEIDKIFNKLKQLYSGTEQQSEFFGFVIDKNIEGFIKQIQLGKNMSEMQTVWLSYKNLTQIPKSISTFKCLKKLGLANNNIKKIEHLENCRFLKELWLDNNQVTDLHGLQDLPKLQHCYLFGNPIAQSTQNEQIIKNLRKKGVSVHLTLEKAAFFKHC